MGDPTSGSPYDGWQSWAHPSSPAGGGGPGRFRSAQPLGSEPWYLPKMTGEDQKRNLQRWQTAKSAVESLAKDASKRLKYMQFRAASRDAKGNLQPPASGRTRIGGNDFF